MENNMEKFKDLISEAKFSGKVEDIKIEDIHPDAKDHTRVANLKSTAEAKMANAITDPIKLVRRTKAYIIKNGDVKNPFIDKMLEMGFTTKQLEKMTSYEPEPELPEPVKRNGKDYGSKKRAGRAYRGAEYSIMNASMIYKGKLSKVIPDLWGDTVILLGLRNGKTKIAICGSASGMKITENGLDYYEIPKNGWLDYQMDTGNGYRQATSEIVLTDYILTKDGEAITKFKDASYSYYVFK
jgi:hypothetical protein